MQNVFLRTLAVGALVAVLFCPVHARAQEPEPEVVNWEEYENGTVYHVATTGSDANPGTKTRPFRSVQKAVRTVVPGDVILVHKGTYYGVIEIKTSGKLGKRIHLRGAGDGEAVLKANFPSPGCDRNSPTRERTIKVINGADYWTIAELTVVNGIVVTGKNATVLDPYVQDRTLPGRADYNLSQAAKLLPMLGVNPSDHIRIAQNKVTRRGIQVVASRWVEVVANEVSHMECGTGVGIGLSRFSDFGLVSGNYVHHGTISGTNVGMEDGVRINAQSNYGLIENNLVEDMVGRGRGFSTDVMASWNKFIGNTARRTIIGLNEEHGGWGNEWSDNRAENVAEVAFKVDSKDNHLTVPNAGVPAYIKFANNCSVNTPKDLGIGAIQASTFENNSFRTFNLSKNVINYWKAVGNRYDGKLEPPQEPGLAKPWCK